MKEYHETVVLLICIEIWNSIRYGMKEVTNHKTEEILHLDVDMPTQNTGFIGIGNYIDMKNYRIID